MATSARKPVVDYHDYKKDPDKYVEVVFDIPDLKKSRFSGVNAKYNLELSERSFTLTVTVTPKNKKPQDWAYSVKKLPDAVVVPANPTKDCLKIEKDEEIVMRLQKVTPKSWAGYLGKDGVGLETEGVQ